MTTAVIIQARMGSSRLPGKTLMELGSSTVLDWVVSRVQMSSRADVVVVATSNLTEDDAIERHLVGSGVVVHRGSSDDVLDRYRGAIERFEPDVVVRVTADCPFVAPSLVDFAVETLIGARADYVSTHLDGRFCRGLDVEACRSDLLLHAADVAVEGIEREHVTPFLYKRPDIYRCAAIPAPDWARHPHLRFTLDEEADLDLLRSVVAAMPASIETEAQKIVQFLTANPQISAINSSVAHRTV